jgi:predicted dehydrogenase
MKFGLIGCGNIGQLRAEALALVGEHQLVAVNDANRNRANVLSAQYHCVVEDEWQKLIQRSDLDAVIISTPPSFHAKMCIEALKTGKHVLCEKPLTRTVQEAKDLVAASEQTGKFLATGFNYRFYPSFVKAREILDSGIIGELDHIRSYAGYTAADHDHEWLHDVNVMGGGAMRDNGIHLIDLTNYFLGGVQEVKGFASENVWGFSGCEDNGFALLRSPAGKIAILQASWTEWRGYKFFIDLYGERGSIHASCFPMITQVTWAERRGGRSKKKTYHFPKIFVMEHWKTYRWIVVQSFIEEHQGFANAVQGKASAIATGYDGLKALEIAQTAAMDSPSGLVAEAKGLINSTSLTTSELKVTPGASALSVVVVPLVGKEALSGCLQAIQDQKEAPDYEVVVPYDDRLGDISSLQEEYPFVKFMRLIGVNTFAELRAVGMQSTKGAVIAITEDHCKPYPDWCEKIWKLHNDFPYAAIGGVVEKGIPDTALDWSFYFADYLRYMKPVTDGPVHALTDLNVSYKRSALESVANRWVDEFHENIVHGALEGMGQTLWLTQDMVVLQQRKLRLGSALWDRYAFGRLFAATRVEHASLLRRMIFIASSVLIPFLQVWRVFNLIRLKGRWKGEFLRALPYLLLISSVWAWGEFLGYLTGRPEATLATKTKSIVEDAKPGIRMVP